MTERHLYNLTLPEDAQTRSQSQLQRQLATQGALGSSTGVVESVSLDPSDQTLRGAFRGKYARLMAAEVEELFDAGGIESVPYHGAGTQTPEDGYYALRNADIGPADPRAGANINHQFDGVLAKEGTRRSHYRSVAVNVTQPTNDFGSDTQARVGAPATASKVRWFDPVSRASEPASSVATRTGEFANVDVYEATNSSFTDVANGDGRVGLIYDVAYTNDPDTDCKVWDDRGVAKTDADGNNAWQHVFRASHEFAGIPVVENTLFRLEIDEANNALSAYRWDTTTSPSSYTSVALGTSDWELYELDLREIGLARVDAQMQFRDTTVSPTAFFRLDMSLERGLQNPRWTVPQPSQQGTTPSGLQTLLDPIANADAYAPNPAKGLRAREEVRT